MGWFGRRPAPLTGEDVRRIVRDEVGVEATPARKDCQAGLRAGAVHAEEKYLRATRDVRLHQSVDVSDGNGDARANDKLQKMPGRIKVEDFSTSIRDQLAQLLELISVLLSELDRVGASSVVNVNVGHDSPPSVDVVATPTVGEPPAAGAHPTAPAAGKGDRPVTLAELRTYAEQVNEAIRAVSDALTKRSTQTPTPPAADPPTHEHMRSLVDELARVEWRTGVRAGAALAQERTARTEDLRLAVSCNGDRLSSRTDIERIAAEHSAQAAS